MILSRNLNQSMPKKALYFRINL